MLAPRTGVSCLARGRPAGECRPPSGAGSAPARDLRPPDLRLLAAHGGRRPPAAAGPRLRPGAGPVLYLRWSYGRRGGERSRLGGKKRGCEPRCQVLVNQLAWR